MAGELFSIMTGAKFNHVPYKGAAASFTDVLGGHVSFMYSGAIQCAPSVKSGKVRALAVTSAKRSPVLPDVPTIAETLPGFDISSWTTLTGPAKLPPDIVTRLSELSKKALESEDLKAKFLEHASVAIWRTPADTLAYRDTEEARLAPIIKASGARVD